MTSEDNEPPSQGKDWFPKLKNDIPENWNPYLEEKKTERWYPQVSRSKDSLLMFILGLFDDIAVLTVIIVIIYFLNVFLKK